VTEATVLVTGAGGFVGSAVVRRFVQQPAWLPSGAEVDHVVALLSPGGSAERLEELSGRRAWSIERVDLSDRDRTLELIARLRPQAIVHVAFPAEGFREVIDEPDDPLVGGPLRNLVEGLSGVPGSRFVHAGSAWVLASGDGLDESARVEPQSPYAWNKARADSLLPALAGDAGVPWINLRLFNLFGRYERPTRLVPMLVGSLARGRVAELTHGEQVRDFNDVDVMAEAFVQALAAPEAACGAIYHIGSGRGLSVRELAHKVAGVLGRPELVRFGRTETRDSDIPHLVADPRLAQRKLGWNPDPDLEARVHAAVEWWLERLSEELAAR
jgi:nucleoside-diphosphate-sugar epimerase